MAVATGRHSSNCLACGSTDLTRDWTVISAFVARRALLCAPGVVPLLHCRTCGTRYYDVVVQEADLARLYADYRGEEYFKQRNAFEPWYTRAFNADLGAEAAMQARRAVLDKVLADAGISNNFTAVLDHGGDRGQMLADLHAQRRAVFEISGASPDPGMEAVDASAVRSGHWDLILSCHVLEHLPEPQAYVAELAALGHANTLYYFEVPNEEFKSFRFNQSGLQRAWLNLVVKSPALFKLMYFLSAGIKHRIGLVPPLLSIPMNEHLTFFSVEGLKRLVETYDLQVVLARVGECGHTTLLARKNLE